MSNVNTYVVAFSRLRFRKNRRENRRQINRTTTVANVTEALDLNVFVMCIIFKRFTILVPSGPRFEKSWF